MQSDSTVFPRMLVERADYVANWRSAPIDPNRSHLMVFTFYEVRHEGDLKFNIGPDKGRWGNALTAVSNWVRGEQGEMFRLPKRQIRRVICRAMIQPSGLNPSARESKAWYNHVIEGMSYLFADDVMPEFGGWLSKILSSISDLPGYLGIRTTELVCSGLGKLDDLTSLGNVSGPPLPAVVDEEGRIRVNAAVKSKLEGAKRCHRISSPPVSTCEGDADQILKGKCVRLPEFKLQVRTAEFIRPLTKEKFDALADLAELVSTQVLTHPRQLTYLLLSTTSTGWRYPSVRTTPKYGEPGFVSVVNAVKDWGLDEADVRPDSSIRLSRSPPVADLTLDPPKELNNRNRGLTRVYLDWDLRWDTISTDFYDSVDGFAVILHPDQKSVSFSVPEEGLPPFYLPKWVSSSF